MNKMPRNRSDTAVSSKAVTVTIVVMFVCGCALILFRRGDHVLDVVSAPSSDNFRSVPDRLILTTVRGLDVPSLTLREWLQNSLLVIRSESFRMDDPSEQLLAQIKSSVVVDLFHTNITDAVRTACVESHSVRWLRLPPDSTAEELEWIGRLRRLRGLALTHAHLADADLSPLGELQELEWLEISNAKVGASVAASLPRLPQLQSLSISGNDSTDSTILELKSDKLPRLRVLWIDNSKITERSVDWVANQFQLEFLSIFGLRLSASSIRSLGSMNELLFLDITASEEQANLLMQLLPNCVISAE